MLRNFTLLKLFLLIVVLLCNKVLYSQDISWKQTNGPYGGDIGCVATHPDGTIYAATGDKLYKSSNNGNYWVDTGLKFVYSLESIIISKNGDIIAGGVQYIYKSSDNGNTWRQIRYSNLVNYGVFSKNPEGDLFVAIENTFYKSIDNGESWKLINNSLPINHTIELSTNSKSDYYIAGYNIAGYNAAGYNTEIYRSTDKGNSWKNVTSNLPTGLLTSIITKAGKVFVARHDGIFVSSNGGDNWNLSYANTSDPFINLEIDSSGNIWAQKMLSLIKTTNDGESWVVKHNVPYILMYKAMVIQSNGNIFAGSSNGVLFFKNNASTYQNLTNGIIGTETVGITVTKNKKIVTRGEYDVFITSDRGNIWNSIGANSIIVHHQTGKISKDEIGNLYYGDQDGIGFSKDNGTSWKKIYITNANGIKEIACGKCGLLFAISDNKVFRSTNGGAFWNVVETYTESSFHNSIFIDKNDNVFHLRSEGIFKSTDNGNNWSKISPDSPLSFGSFIINRKGYLIAGTKEGTFISKDNGINWTFRNFDIPSNSANIQLMESPDSRIFIIRNDVLLYSSDDGTTWNFLYYPIGGGLGIDKEGYLYSGSKDKGIFRTNSPILSILPPEVQSRYGNQKAIISWNKNTSANFSKYRIYGSINHYPVAVIDSTLGGANDTTIVISGLTNDVPYYIVVSAVDNEGNESFSEEVSVTPIAVPEKPNLQFPENNMVNLSPDCLLRWNKVQSAERYSLQIAEDSIFTEIVVNDSLVTDTSYNANSLVYDRKYYWRMKASNISGESNWSDTWSFRTVIAPPEKPSLLQPDNNAINLQVNVSVKWNNLNTAEKYHLQIAGTNNFSNKVVNDSLLADTLKQVSLENNKTYYWRVRAGNIGGYSSWSEIWNFKTIAILPGIPVLVSPVNESKNQPKVIKVVWDASINAETYRFQLSEEQGFVNTVYNDSTIKITSKYLSGFKTGMKYFWRVKAMNAAGMSDYSPVWSFTTLLPAPENLNAVSTELRKVNLTWNDKSENETGYILERNTEGEVGYRGIDTIKTDVVTCIDSTVTLATKYKYRIKSYTLHAVSAYSNEVSVTTLTSVDELKAIPTEYLLTQNYPNPFNPVTNINYQIPKEGFVTLKVYDILGREIVTLVNEHKPIGKYTVEFNANNLVSGTYIYELKVNDYKSIKKLTLLK